MPWPSRQQYQQRNVYNTLNNNQYGQNLQQNAQARTPYSPNNGNPRGVYNMPHQPMQQGGKPMMTPQRPPMPMMAFARRRPPMVRK